MNFPLINYASQQLQTSPLNDLIKNALSGYTDTTKAQFLRPTLQEQLQKAQLENKWYEPNIKSQIGLRGAQAGHLGAMTEGLNISNPFLRQKLEDEQTKRQFELQNPFFGQTGTSGDLGRLLYLQQMVKNNPELAAQLQSQQSQQPQLNQGQSYLPPIQSQQTSGQPQPFDMSSLIQDAFSKVAHGKDKQFAPSPILKLQQELKDIESGKYPGTNESIPNEQLKEELAAPYRERLGGLEKGSHYIYNPETHEKIGQEKPYTAKERETETGRAFFNEVFPDINNAFKDFIGKDSVKNFVKFANEYGRNPEATRKIDDLLLGQKLISAGVVNEAATLGAGKTNQTYKNLQKSFPGSDIPNLIERYGKELKLPTDAFVKAGVRFQNKINQASEKASTSVPAMKKVYFHPEKYLKSDEEKSREREEKITKSSGQKKGHYTDTDIRATAQKYGLSEKEVRERLRKAG